MNANQSCLLFFREPDKIKDFTYLKIISDILFFRARVLSYGSHRYKLILIYSVMLKPFARFVRLSKDHAVLVVWT